MKHQTKVLLAVVAVLSLSLLGASRPSQKWEYAQLNLNNQLNLWDFESVQPPVSQDNAKDAPDTLLKALGGVPLPGTTKYGSGVFPVVQQIGKNGWELVTVTHFPDRDSYIFKRQSE